MLNSRISAAPSGTAPATAGRGVTDLNTDFRAAYASAVNAQEAVAAGSGGTSGGHVVKAGETLYGIARARLAAAGQAATPGASMRHALDIAKANEIRNPDRIRTGQQLVLAPLSPRVMPRIDATAAGTEGIALPGYATASANLDDRDLPGVDELDAQLDLSEADAPEWSEIVRDAKGMLPSFADLPTSALIAAQPITRSEDAGPAVPRADLSLYTRAAPEAPKSSDEVPDIVYKGVIGKALDLLPIEPSTRTGLQQANAVVSSSIAARTLAAATGIGGPILTIAGLVWGLFAASKIGAQQSAEPKQVTQNDVTARLTR